MTRRTGLDQATLAHLQRWIGRGEEAEDIVAAARYAALAATLNHDTLWPSPGSELPPLWHWTLCAPLVRQSEIGPDGHPQRGGFLPPVPLPRRLWAGGRLNFAQPLRVGEAVRRRSRVATVEHKTGRSGDLVFVRVAHEYSGSAGVAISEEHDIVYRGLPNARTPPASPAAAPQESTWQRTVQPDDVLLFRYSALTFNGHRIHYDRRYAVEIEGYPGLVVHGPLIATLLVELLRQEQPRSRITRFEFRALRPLFDTAPFAIHGQPLSNDDRTVRLWARDMDGALAMDATATLA